MPVSTAMDDEAPHSVNRLTREWLQARPDLELSDFLLALYLARLGTLVEQAYADMSQRLFGLHGADMRVLLTLRRMGAPYALRPTDLFRSLLVTAGAVTKQIDRLEAGGFVERRRDPSHRGGSLVALTERGLETIEKVLELLATQSPLRRATEGLSSEAVAEGTEFCRLLLERLDRFGVHVPGRDPVPDR